ncbi:MAG: hypothetical protein ABJO52_20875 [Nisaea sp.]|uniref:hypothetical protein n=1 Tax=Nisaea sp. TaxID=2024842 RepID=UPI00329825A5
MDNSVDILEQEQKKLNWEKCKSGFTATTRDYAAIGAMITTAIIILGTGKMSEWERQASQEFNCLDITSGRSLQEHIEVEQVVGILGYFILIYIASVLGFWIIRYVIFDSPLLKLLNLLYGAFLRLLHWLWAQFLALVKG